MSQCVHCGRDLPALTFGNLQDTCPDCRQQVIERPAEAPAEVVPRVVLPAPMITRTLVGLCVLVFVAMVLRGVSVTSPTFGQLILWGADFGPLTLHGQWWRLLTSAFVHIGLLHIALNMWCLWNLGLLAEAVLGRATYLSIYLLCAAGSGVLSLAVHPTTVSAGASGAIFGIAGALLAVFYVGKVHVQRQALKPILRSLLSFAGYNLILGTIIPGIDNAAHVGGLVTGLITGALLARFARREQENAAARRRVILAAVAIMIACGAMLVARVYT